MRHRSHFHGGGAVGAEAAADGQVAGADRGSGGAIHPGGAQHEATGVHECSTGEGIDRRKIGRARALAGTPAVGSVHDQRHRTRAIISDCRGYDHVTISDVGVSAGVAQRVDINVASDIRGARRDGAVLDGDRRTVGGVSRDQASAAQGEDLAAQIQGGRAGDDEGERVDIAIGGQGRRADGADADVIGRGCVMDDRRVVARIASGAQAAHAHPGGVGSELSLEDGPAADETIGQRRRRREEKPRLPGDSSVDTHEPEGGMTTIRPGQGGRGDIVLIGPGAGFGDVDDARPFVERQRADDFGIVVAGVGAELQHAATNGHARFVAQTVHARRHGLVGGVIASEQNGGVGDLERRETAQAGGVDELRTTTIQEHLAGEILVAAQVPILVAARCLAAQHIDGVADSSGEADVSGRESQRRRLRGGIGDVPGIVGGIEIIAGDCRGLGLEVTEMLRRTIQVDCTAKQHQGLVRQDGEVATVEFQRALLDDDITGESIVS